MEGGTNRNIFCHAGFWNNKVEKDNIGNTYLDAYTSKPTTPYATIDKGGFCL
jgi:hypothetical protein